MHDNELQGKEIGKMDKQSDNWWQGYTDGGLDYQRSGTNPVAEAAVAEWRSGTDYELGYHQGWEDAKQGKDYPLLPADE